MIKMSEKSEFAKTEIDSDEYKSKIQELEDRLHNLRDEMTETEVEVLQDIGYKPINIDGNKIMTPVGMTMRQLYVSLQQLPPPKEGDEPVKFLVSDEDISNVREDSRYRQIVEEREQIIGNIKSEYRRFWDNEVKQIAQTDAEKITYMLAGLDRNIRSKKISDITGVSDVKCRNYRYKGGVVYFDDD